MKSLVLDSTSSKKQLAYLSRVRKPADNYSRCFMVMSTFLQALADGRWNTLHLYSHILYWNVDNDGICLSLPHIEIRTCSTQTGYGVEFFGALPAAKCLDEVWPFASTRKRFGDPPMPIQQGIYNGE
ncbi:predicted protein [Histoplasma capsulatum G186AR]|uniref:Uncharacterized protein n=1 Tax=Ajellomyces capsulatus (strain G186AR / H82 / ATCC MYA-2454 / RMSCC 2432) TaxID=447093 RepID=C0NHU4_AJECG|nr:uncharacterized protein HCBG_02916 [Histoplasma capsulatum G186AR]EEH09379.1 predicted protein [Histoplasma capsulatum G186AR]